MFGVKKIKYKILRGGNKEFIKAHQLLNEKKCSEFHGFFGEMRKNCFLAVNEDIHFNYLFF